MNDGFRVSHVNEVKRKDILFSLVHTTLKVKYIEVEVTGLFLLRVLWHTHARTNTRARARECVHREKGNIHKEIIQRRLSE